MLLKLNGKVVEMMGIEPMTPCLQGRCSPSWATPPHIGTVPYFFFKDLKIRQNLEDSIESWRSFKIEQQLLKRTPRYTTLKLQTPVIDVFVLHRKEVIQPHLPIRLPCYDLTPITEPTFNCCLLAVSSQASGVSNFHGLTGGVYKARERIHRGMLIRDY